MDRLEPWEVLEERAAQAVVQARLLVAERHFLTEQITANYRYRCEVAKMAFERVQRAHHDLGQRLGLNFSGSPWGKPRPTKK